MKKLLALTAACLLTAGIAPAAEPSESDQKWLQVVEKKIAAGQSEVSTPVPERVDLLKQWAAHNGYTAQVTQAGANFRIELSKSVAQK